MSMSNSKVLSLIKQVKETTCPKEVARLLSGGNWIAIFAAENEDNITFVLGRIE